MVVSCEMKMMMYRAWILLLLIEINIAHAKLPFSFGTSHGDNMVPHGDDGNVLVTMDSPVKFWNKDISDFYIDFNGAIHTKRYTRIVSSDPWWTLPGYDILTFFIDTIFENCGDCGIYYRKNPDSSTLNKINQIISSEQTIFYEADPNRTLILTYHNALEYRDRSRRNTYQAVITSNGVKSYLILAYSELQYPRPSSDKPKVGYYIHSSFSCKLHGSDSPGARDLACRSNIFTPGTFVIGLTPSSGYQCIGGTVKHMDYICSHCDGDEEFKGTCNLESAPNCGTNGLSYQNDCEFKRALCQSHGNFSVLHEGACVPACDETNCINGTCLQNGTCFCDSGYQGDTCDEDVNECIGNHACNRNAQCVNNIGSYDCICKKGFTGNGFDCLDINDCASFPCQHGQTCEDLVDGYNCRCQSPWTGKNCEIYMPCLTDNGGCEEFCNYTTIERPNRCSCSLRPLSPNLKDCEDNYYAIVAFNKMISYDSINQVNQVQFGPIQDEDLVIEQWAVGLDYDYDTDMLFITDRVAGNIISMNKNGTNIIILAKAQNNLTSDLDDVAYDSVTGNVYWSEGKNIYMVQRNGTIVHVAAEKNKIRSLLLLSEHCFRRIYWTQWALPEPSIRYTDMDHPTNSTPVVDVWIYLPNGLTADRVTKKIYWLDLEFDRIEVADFDGSNREQIGSLAPDAAPYALTYFNHSLYFTNWKGGKLERFDLIKKQLFTIFSYTDLPYGVKIYQPKTPDNLVCTTSGVSTTSSTTDPCLINNGNCEDLCTFLGPNKRRCECRNGFIQPDMKSCSQFPFVYFATKSSLIIHTEKNTTVIASFSGTSSSAVDHDYNKQRLFFVQHLSNGSVISSVNFYGEEKKDLFTVPDFVIGLAYDSHDTLYFTDETNNGTVAEIRNIDSNPRRYVIAQLQKPRTIVIEFCQRKLFIADWGLKAIVEIDKLRQVKAVIKDLHHINALSVDPLEQKLYWADAYSDLFERSNYDGSCRESLFHYNSHSFALHYYNGIMYWTSWTKAVYRTNIISQQTELIANLTSSPYGIGMFYNKSHVKCNIQAHCSQPQSEMYPYGPLYDRVGERGDDDSKIILNLTQPMLLFSEYRSQIFININGHISIFRHVTTFNPINLPYSVPILVPYGIDLKTTVYGNIYFRESFEAELLNATSMAVAEHTSDDQFEANHAVVITWDRVRFYGSKFQLNTFQVVIVSDGKQSYAIFVYDHLDTPGGVVGFSENSCNWKEVNNRTSKELVKKKKLFLSLTNYTCFPNTTFTPPNTTFTPPTNTLPTVAPSAVLYPYGYVANDSEAIPYHIGNQTYIYGYIHSTRGFPFLTRRLHHIYVNFNGYITEGNFDTGNSISFPYNRTVVAGFARAFDINQFILGGKIFYRLSRSRQDLNRAAADIAKHQNGSSSLFSPHEMIVATYINLSTRNSSFENNTFQIVLVTDDSREQLYIIFNYAKLWNGYASAGYYESPCVHHELANPNTFDGYNLQFRSNIGIAGRFVSMANSTSCTDGHNNSFIHLGKSKISVFGVFRTTLAVYSSSTSAPQTVLLELISGSSPGSIFLNGIQHRQTVSYISSAGVIMNELQTSIEIIAAAIYQEPQTRTFQYGRISTSYFASRFHCHRHDFDEPMFSTPNVKLNVEVPYRLFYFAYTSVWLRDVSRFGFTVCYKELISFSGIRNISIHFLAISPEEGNKVEVKTKMFSGNLTLHTKDYNRRFCDVVHFKYVYRTPPNVLVQAEEGDTGPGGVLTSWVHSIERSHAILCAKNSLDTLEYRVKSIKLHYLVTGEQDACSTVKCPAHLECRLKFDGKPFCGCILNCTKSIEDTGNVCGTDLVTYKSICHLYKETCNRYGPEKSGNISVAYPSECQQIPYDSGIIELDNVPGIPVAFCKYITLMKSLFNPLEELQVLLTVSWENPLALSQINDATASWSENVTISGFKACVLIAGRHFFGLESRPSIHWVAFQTGAIYATNGLLDGHIVELPTWYTGSRCQFLNITTEFNSPNNKYFVSVEHNTANNFKDAMTAWVERTYVTWMKMYEWRVCARELQNFDGIHQGIRLHVMGIKAAVRMHISEFHEITFPAMFVGVDQPIPAICKTTRYNSMFPSLPNPTIILTGLKTVVHASSYFSTLDLSVWLEGNNATHMRVCFKSLRAGLMQEEMRISYMLFPRICPVGWKHHHGYCYQTQSQLLDYRSAGNLCRNLNATLPHVDSITRSYFMKSLAVMGDTWLGLTDRNQENIWVWHSGFNSSYRNWDVDKPDGGTNENCAVIDQFKNAWDDRSCNTKMNVVCQKDAATLKNQPCLDYCLNDGYCYIDNSQPFCLCTKNYTGKTCDTKVSADMACKNYVTHNETQRLYSNHTTALYGSCDRSLTSNTTWHRFILPGGVRLLEDFCTHSQYRCGVVNPGWLKGPHPRRGDGVVEREIHYYSHYCASDYGRVLIRNCGDFFVYKFTYLPYWSCNFGLCTVP